jgi:hypothetical protein
VPAVVMAMSIVMVTMMIFVVFRFGLGHTNDIGPNVLGRYDLAAFLPYSGCFEFRGFLDLFDFEKTHY